MSHEVEFTVKVRGLPDGNVASSISNVSIDQATHKGTFNFVDKQSKLDFQLIYAAIVRRFKNGQQDKG